jgi:hypothetical protein
MDLALNDPRIIYRLGNLTAASTSEVLVSARAYNEPASQAQRSVKSSSASDGSAKTVRISYLDSAYVRKSEDVVLNGTTAVDTVGTDIRFIEAFDLVKGAAAVGAIELFPNTGGTGTAICGIGAATLQAFLCHHYVEAGKECWVARWEGTTDDEASFKLLGQDRTNGVDLVDRVLDLEKKFSNALSPPILDAEFGRTLLGVKLPEKSYVRVTVVPNQTTSTVVRARLYLWEP